MTTAAITVANIYYNLVALYVYEEMFLIQVLPVKHIVFYELLNYFMICSRTIQNSIKKQSKWFQFSSA